MAQAGRARRGLSPLIAAIILIGITLVGGAMVYAYFNKSMDTVAALGEGLFVKATSADLGAAGKLVHIEAINNYGEAVDVTALIAIDEAGNQNRIQLQTTITINPGDRATITEIVPANTKVVIVEYQVNGQTLLSDPIEVE